MQHDSSPVTGGKCQGSMLVKRHGCLAWLQRLLLLAGCCSAATTSSVLVTCQADLYVPATLKRVH